jgi:outer membrane protein assembly factor BamB
MHTFPRRLLPALLTVAALAPMRPAAGQTGADILKQSGVTGGLVVHVGCGDGSLTAQFAGDGYVVQGLDRDAAGVAVVRTKLRGAGVYGQVSVDRWDGENLPYADNLVNLLVVSSAECRVSGEEIIRVLAPRGVVLANPHSQIRIPQSDVVGEWRVYRKPVPDDIDDWTHYLHGADGNPVADDSVVAPPTRLQWVGSPKWARHHDHMASMTSLVSAGGRLFYIFDEGPTASIQLPSSWQLIARDAFNGTVLWKRKIDRWNTRHYPLKSGPAHLLRRLVAVGDRVYVTLGIDAPVTALDAATGKTVKTYEGSGFAREILASEGTLFLVADGAPSKLPDFRRVSSYVWDNTNKANKDWGWNGTARKVLAYDVESGKPLWQKTFPVAPCSLAADAKRVVLHDGGKLVCLDRRSGDTLWQGVPSPTRLPVLSNTGPRVLLYGDAVLLAANNGKMSGWDAATGKRLWEQKHRPSGHLSLKDLFVVDGLAWTAAIAGSGDAGVFAGHDPLTGEIKREFKPDVKVHWFHHRCYPAKAAGKYLITGRQGTEYVDLEKQSWKPNHWMRGGCIYGVMPCNGMTYASMHACGCQLEAKLTGFNALASGGSKLPKVELSKRLEKGIAYGSPSPQSAVRNPKSLDWPTYRHDAGRSGACASAVGAALGATWRAKIGGRLTAPTVAAGKLYVASIDRHRLHALDVSTGREAWTFAAGGRIDSPPTCFKGLALFGSADGYVYALRASDGELAWRFRAAPIDRRVMAWEQLESAWPVHGSVLVHDGVLYCTAGRSFYLDGGVRMLRLDPVSGRLLGETVMDDMDPVSGRDMHRAYLEKTQGNNMPVGLSDVLSCDGRHVWMRSQKFTLEGKRLEIGLEDINDQPAEDCHLFCQIGFLDDSYFFRSYWTYGRRVGGGYGGWFQAGRLVPSGRILCYDDERVYGYGRKPQYMVNSSVIEYQFFASDKTATRETIERIRKFERGMNARSKKKNASSSDWRLRHFFPPEELTAARYQWTVDQPSVLARAMAVAGDAVLVAGPQDILDERWTYSLPDDPEVQKALVRQAELLTGRHGGELWVLGKEDGKVRERRALGTVPVFDGFAVAGGALFMSGVDGSVTCFRGGAREALSPVEERPLQVAWDEPEDPGYLVPLPVDKSGDFARVRQCKVNESKLGYRLRGAGTKKVGLALKKLERPIRGRATFSTRMMTPAEGKGLLRNGYLAFGAGTDDASLIKCGVRMQPQRAAIHQGPLVGGKGKSMAIKAKQGEIVDMRVTVDLEAGKVSYRVKGESMEVKLANVPKSITHVGYAMENALVDFAPIEIERTD